VSEVRSQESGVRSQEGRRKKKSFLVSTRRV